MLDTEELIAFVPTTDLARARQFYADALGLALVRDDGFAATFDAHGTSLRVTKVPEHVPAPFTVLGWKVADICASARKLAARRVTCVRFDGMDQDGDGIWTAPGGDRVAWFRDPDGNLLSITEGAR